MNLGAADELLAYEQLVVGVHLTKALVVRQGEHLGID